MGSLTTSGHRDQQRASSDATALLQEAGEGARYILWWAAPAWDGTVERDLMTTAEAGSWQKLLKKPYLLVFHLLFLFSAGSGNWQIQASEAVEHHHQNTEWQRPFIIYVKPSSDINESYLKSLSRLPWHCKSGESSGRFCNHYWLWL